MYQKVQGYLTMHAAALATIPMVATLQAELDTEVAVLQTHAVTANADMSGHTVDKQGQRSKLKASLLKVSTAVIAHASINSINKLLEKCDETPAALDSLRDNDFYTYAQTVIAEATPIAASLAPYNVAPADITTVQTDAADFLTIIQDPRLQINERANALNDAIIQFEKIDDLLKSKLDKVMAVFISQNPSLYNGYQGARAIDDDGGSATEPDYAGIINANETLHLATIPYLAGRTFKFKNLGTTLLSFGLGTDPNALSGTPVDVPGSSESQRSTANLHTDAAAEQLIVNNAQAQAAEYKIWIWE
jgi:hypothetical protein